jgi:hypothetical protein
MTTGAQSFSGTKTFSGIIANAFVSSVTPRATFGVVEMANTDVISWRNAGNTADVKLGVNTSNQLTWENVRIGPFLPPIILVKAGAGSGTYFPPTGTLYLRIIIVGAGGGAAGSSTASDATSGTNGGLSTINDGATTWFAGGGGGAPANLMTDRGGQGGLNTSTGPGTNWSFADFPGNDGQGASQSASFSIGGPMYGSPIYGSWGRGGMGAAIGANGTSGAAGGSGAVAEIYITNPAAAWPYTVGTKGTNGAGGTGGNQSVITPFDGFLMFQAFFQ